MNILNNTFNRCHVYILEGSSLVVLATGGMSLFVDANFFANADFVKKAIPFVVN